MDTVEQYHVIWILYQLACAHQYITFWNTNVRCIYELVFHVSSRSYKYMSMYVLYTSLFSVPLLSCATSERHIVTRG